MKGKISSKQLCGAVALVGVLVVAIVYVTVFQKYNNMTKALEASNAALDQRVSKLKKYYLEEPMYKENMETLSKEIDELLEPYPADIRDEDILMQSIYTQMNSPIVYSNINIGEKTIYSTVAEDVVKNAGVEKYQSSIVFSNKTATLANEVTYEGLKEAVTSLFESEYMIDIENISYSKGNEGMLNGSMNVCFFSASGTGKEYERPNIAQYQPGTMNIFGMEEEEASKKK